MWLLPLQPCTYNCTGRPWLPVWFSGNVLHVSPPLSLPHTFGSGPPSIWHIATATATATGPIAYLQRHGLVSHPPPHSSHA